MATPALACSSQDQLHPVVSDARFVAPLGSHPVEFCRKHALVAGDNFRAAVRDDCARHALFRAPTQLRTNGRMAYQRVASLANERAGDRRAVSNITLHVCQSCAAIVDEQEIWSIKIQASPALTRYATAGARIECSTGNASNVMPQISVGARSLISWGLSILHFSMSATSSAARGPGRTRRFAVPMRDPDARV